MHNNFTCVHWFKHDLRLNDNPALSKTNASSIIPLYIIDPGEKPRLGQRSLQWLQHSLYALNKSLQGMLNVVEGNTLAVLKDLFDKHPIDCISWNKLYEPWHRDLEEQVATLALAHGIKVVAVDELYLWRPAEIVKADGGYYTRFIPFHKAALKHEPRQPYQRPELRYQKIFEYSWKLQSLPDSWTAGEVAAADKLHAFIENKIHEYEVQRNYPDRAGVSTLSPHLHFGEISPHMIWAMIGTDSNDSGVQKFRYELAWREFSAYLLYHFPKLDTCNFKQHFPWQNDVTSLKQWQDGMTGYPIVDAGMRQLKQTGYMHNRVRMLVGSFLVKNLLIHWKHGMNHFWDHLFDADLANNSANWQWVAGSGPDGSFFRMFNPTVQGKRFDPDGRYTRLYVPELKDMPLKYLFEPWIAPSAVLCQAGVQLGITYPKPILDLKTSRNAAREAYRVVKVPGSK